MKAIPCKQMLLIPAILSALLLTACSAAFPSANAEANLSPSIKILVPRSNPSGIGISGDSLCPVLVEVENFKLAEKQGQQNIPGEGHIHYFLDVEPPIAAGIPAVTAGGTFADTGETSYFWPPVGKGEHMFWVELVNNDHTPLNPPVIASTKALAGKYWNS
jgi:hypothetical protein